MFLSIYLLHIYVEILGSIERLILPLEIPLLMLKLDPNRLYFLKKIIVAGYLLFFFIQPQPSVVSHHCGFTESVESWKPDFHGLLLDLLRIRAADSLGTLKLVKGCESG
jgi:hypothetical protein